MSAKAVYLDEPERRYLPIKAPGEWRFIDPKFYVACKPPPPGQEALLQFACLKHGGICGQIRVGNGFKPPGKKTWNWNGSVDQPTLIPSINCLAQGPNGERYAGCGWHAHLTDGVWGD